MKDLAGLADQIAACRRCPRLVTWREQVATEKRTAFRDEEYWGRPVPGFGDPQARLLIVGLAPAAHGANRTGRMFTGDRSGDWLIRALHHHGFANQPESTHRGDGLELSDVWITAAVRCAPPGNRPTADERANCAAWLDAEIALLPSVAVVVALGQIGYHAVWDHLRRTGATLPRLRPRFGHGSTVQVGELALITSYHPSQQNTFTGRLTAEMFDAVFAAARAALP